MKDDMETLGNPYGTQVLNLQQALARKDLEIQQLVEKDHRLDELMARAVSIAEMATSFSVTEYPVMVLEALVFLDSPKVIAWRKKQEEQ